MKEDILEKVILLKEIAKVVDEKLPDKYKETAFKILAEYYIIYKNIHSNIKEVTATQKSERGEIAFGEFISKLKENPRNNAEKLTLLLYYLSYLTKSKDKYVDLNKKLVEKYFTEVAWKIPENLPRDLKRAIKNMYIAKSDKGYYILENGVHLVEKLMGFNTKKGNK